MELAMPNGERVDTWYTFQVDTTSGEIIVYFALFDEEKQSILSTVRVDNYSKGNDLTKAEITLFYPDGMQRVIGFDGVAGTISLTQTLQSTLRTQRLFTGIAPLDGVFRNGIAGCRC